MTAIMKPALCPECESPLQIDEHAETLSTMWRKGTPGVMPYVEETLRPCVVAFCTGCEFAVEIRPMRTN